VPVTVSWLSVPAVLLGGWFLAVRWRRAATGSPIDYIATRYTPEMCGTLAVLGLPMQLLDNALKLLAIGTVVGVGMGFPLFWSICLSGVIIVAYTVMGGLKATLACDFIQFLFILAVVFALPPLCLERLAETGGGSGLAHGWKVFLENVPDGFFNFTNGKYGWIYMLVFFCCVGSTLSTNWSLVQRYYSTKSDRDARKMAYLVAALLFVGPPLFFFPAMAARVFLPEIPDSEMNGVYALLCREVLPGLFSYYEMVRISVNPVSGRLVGCNVFYFPLLDDHAQGDVPLSREEAVALSRAVKQLDVADYVLESAEVAVVLPNWFFTEYMDGNLQYSKVSRLGWVLNYTKPDSEFADEITVWIDCYSGEVLGGGMT
jgi:hypothetical protein